MPQIRKAFEALEGQNLTFNQLREAAQKIRADNLSLLPADLNSKNLIEFALRSHWVKMGDDGFFHVKF